MDYINDIDNISTIDYVKNCLGEDYTYDIRHDGSVIIHVNVHADNGSPSSFSMLIPNNYDEGLNLITFNPGNNTGGKNDLPAMFEYDSSRNTNRESVIYSNFRYQEDYIDFMAERNPNSVLVVSSDAYYRPAAEISSNEYNEILNKLNININNRIISAFSDGGCNAIINGTNNGDYSTIVMFDSNNFNNSSFLEDLEKLHDKNTSVVLFANCSTDEEMKKRFGKILESNVDIYLIHTDETNHFHIMEKCITDNVYSYFCGDSLEISDNSDSNYVIYHYNYETDSFEEVNQSTAQILLLFKSNNTYFRDYLVELNSLRLDFSSSLEIKKLGFNSDTSIPNIETNIASNLLVAGQELSNKLQRELVSIAKVSDRINELELELTNEAENILNNPDIIYIEGDDS